MLEVTMSNMMLCVMIVIDVVMMNDDHVGDDEDPGITLPHRTDMPVLETDTDVLLIYAAAAAAVAAVLVARAVATTAATKPPHHRLACPQDTMTRTVTFLVDLEPSLPIDIESNAIWDWGPLGELWNVWIWLQQQQQLHPATVVTPTNLSTTRQEEPWPLKWFARSNDTMILQSLKLVLWPMSIVEEAEAYPILLSCSIDFNGSVITVWFLRVWVLRCLII